MYEDEDDDEIVCELLKMYVCMYNEMHSQNHLYARPLCYYRIMECVFEIKRGCHAILSRVQIGTKERIALRRSLPCPPPARTRTSRIFLSATSLVLSLNIVLCITLSAALESQIRIGVDYGRRNEMCPTVPDRASTESSSTA